MEYVNKENFWKSWYALSSPTHTAGAGPLSHNFDTDVCIVGAGFTGLSAALELARAGYRVVVLEAGAGAGASASGLNGGHIQRGLAQSPAALGQKLGYDATRAICDMTLEGIDLMRNRITEHAIDCDLHMGQITTALTPRHMQELDDERLAWRKFGHDDLTLLDQRGCESLVRGQGYIGGLYDGRSGHFDPYAYAQGLARAVQKNGAVLYSHTRVTDIRSTGGHVHVTTEHGPSVRATHALVAGAIALPGMRPTLKKSISATAHMIATAPLDPATARRLMPGNVAVADANFIMNYFRLSRDNRLLFGGNCNYSGQTHGSEHLELQQRLRTVFPELESLAIDHCWHGPLDLTANRLPCVGRLGANIFYAHGFGGHGVALTNLIGKLVAEAIAGSAERFDIFERIDHMPFIGGPLAKRPLFMLGMLWYQLRDALRR